MNKPLISICITSYNRINELIRLLNSIDTKYIDEIEVIVSEDHSPLREQIEDRVIEYSKTSLYQIIFNSNKENLGYDNNLAKLISLSSGKYTLFMSDDDIFISGALDKIVKLLKHEEVDLFYTPFMIREFGEYRRIYDLEKIYFGGEEYASKHIMDAILFSGLVFLRDSVESIDAKEFLNCNYFQVYLYLSTAIEGKGLYANIPLVDCIADGENAYGIAESSGGNRNLVDRESIFANVSFHIGLVKVIKTYDKRNKTDVLSGFTKEYSLRSYGGLARARKAGGKIFNEYLEKVDDIGLKMTPIYYIYIFILKVFGADKSNSIMLLPKRLVLRKRHGNVKIND